MAATIPIILSPQPAPNTTVPADFNQLVTAICGYVAASINQNVGFFTYGNVDPGVFTTVMFFNRAQGIWKYWDVGTGSYQAVTQFRIGDRKSSYNLGDEVQGGWIVLNGRAIDAVSGISLNQKLALESLFGANGVLPLVRSLDGFNNMPPNGSFSAINNPDVAPAAGVIGGLPFDPTYQSAQVANLATNTETLRGSASTTQAALANSLAKSEAMLQSINGAPTDAKTQVKVFCGYPS